MAKGVTIYFMRHAQTYLNKYNRMQGWADAPLTDKGVVDVRQSARGLADVDFQAVYTSDLQRTVQTAEIVLEENHYADKNLRIENRPDFREVFFGSLEGLPAADIWDQIGQNVNNDEDSYSGLIADDAVKRELNFLHDLDPYHDAEDFMNFWMRVELGLIDVITKHRESDKTILIVSHGMTIRNMIHELIPDFQIDSLLDNASVSIVRYEDGQYHLEAYNQTEHFKTD